MSWTCHEHATAWSRSGSLQAAAERGGEDPTGLAPASVNVCNGTIECSENPTKDGFSDREVRVVENYRDNAGPDADDEGIGRVIGSSSRSSGKNGKWLGVLAKIKVRFGRNAR